MLRALSGGMLFGDVTGADERLEVVGLHGWRRTRADMSAPLRGLPGVALDLPGFGASPPPPEPMGAAGYARLVLDALAELTSDRLVMLGHSFGGRVAVCAAAQQPERVRALVLTGVPLVRTAAAARPRVRFRLARTLHRWSLVSDAHMEALRQRYGSDDYRQASGIMRSVLVQVVNESYERELGAIRCPVELVWGAADDVATVEMATRAASLIPDASLTVLAGVGHLTPTEAPDALRAAVERHLSARA